MRIATRTFAIAFAALTLAIGSAQAHGRHGGHRHHHGHWGAGVFLGGVGLGIGIGAARHYYGAPWYPGYAYPGYAYPGYVVVEPPPVAYHYEPPPLPPREPAARRLPDPIFYPREGQTAAQTEGDRQACNRWATTQPNAMADASVFHRATLACMEGRGYTVR
jgi:hypothetical protein